MSGAQVTEEALEEEAERWQTETVTFGSPSINRRLREAYIAGYRAALRNSEAEPRARREGRSPISLVTFNVSARTMAVMEGSDLLSDPIKYDGGTDAAYAASNALKDAENRRWGGGYTNVVTTTREGAEVILSYCQTVAASFAASDDPDARAEGRALLSSAKIIEKAIHD